MEKLEKLLQVLLISPTFCIQRCKCVHQYLPLWFLRASVCSLSTGKLLQGPTTAHHRSTRGYLYFLGSLFNYYCSEAIFVIVPSSGEVCLAIDSALDYYPAFPLCKFAANSQRLIEIIIYDFLFYSYPSTNVANATHIIFSVYCIRPVKGTTIGRFSLFCDRLRFSNFIQFPFVLLRHTDIRATRRRLIVVLVVPAVRRRLKTVDWILIFNTTCGCFLYPAISFTIISFLGIRTFSLMIKLWALRLSFIVLWMVFTPSIISSRIRFFFSITSTMYAYFWYMLSISPIFGFRLSHERIKNISSCNTLCPYYLTRYLKFYWHDLASFLALQFFLQAS